jgi:predicted GH43/DUF377 family glycosyl hydrolase
MTNVHGDPREMFTRSARNPILTAEAFPRMVNAVFNPGVVSFEGETLLLARVEARTGLSSLVVATSANGVDGWRIDRDRGMEPELDSSSEQWGIEDPRITQVGDAYYIVYTGYGVGGPTVCLAVTRDFVTFERRGVIHTPDDKDAALFPRMFDGRWALIHRPAPVAAGLAANMWISWSPDLHHWGDARIVMHARRGGWWDANKIGLGPPPLETGRGWLVCYHGVRLTASGSIYRLGMAMLDLDDPRRVIMRGDEWVFGPVAPYERYGDVGDVVFPCGWLVEDDGDTLQMYYGAADSTICLATASLSDLIGHLESHPCSPSGPYQGA